MVKREGQILVVIDEAQITFSNRDWNAPGRMEWIRFFIQHRKLGMRVILVVQDLGMIDKQIRAVVETTGNHMKVNSYGAFGMLVTVLALGRPVCMCVYRLPFYGSSKNGIIGREAIVGKRRLYRMYDTHAMFSNDMLLDGVWSKDGCALSLLLHLGVLGALPLLLCNMRMHIAPMLFYDFSTLSISESSYEKLVDVGRVEKS